MLTRLKLQKHYQDNMITSTANAQVKNLAQLIKKSKVRTEQGVYIVEGLKMFQEAPKEEKLYRVQVGAYSKRENAEAMKEKLISDGYPAYVKED